MALAGCAAALGAEPRSPAADGQSTSKSVTAASPAARYSEARALERRGDGAGALRAYEEAAQAGHGRAQMRLAEIYDKGNASVRRDYAKALHWYEKARAQGMQVARPHPYVSGR